MLGHELLFNAGDISSSPFEQLKNTIVHELGHAISYAHDWHKHHNCRVGECVACELQAYSYMASWGFDPFLGMLPKTRGKYETLSDRFMKR